MPTRSFSFGTVLLIFLQAVAVASAFSPQSTTIHNSNEKLSKASCLGATAGKDIERRIFIGSAFSLTAAASFPRIASAKPKTRYVLDDETGDYVEVVDEGDWQTEWKSRYDQMSKMSKDEIFVAARGAGNLDSKDLANESQASKKRRAFSGCRDKGTRAKLDNISEKECSKRVLEGDFEFVLGAL